ncbi:MAG: response regulator [Campylobacteraceae bacterium]|nr:response regulator [Campylobacteraceae bacterium]
MIQKNNQKNPMFEFVTSNYNILILDDSKSVNLILTKTFQDKGYKCFNVFTIKDAKQVLANNDIHYVMLDINLPDGNGYELITLLEKSSVKIFVLTTESDKKFREKSYQKGILDFIVKDKNFFHKIDQIAKTIENIEKNRTHTILVMEDSLVIQEQLRDVLENRYYKVEVASDSRRAEQILAEIPIDLILLDLVLKDGNGIDFLRRNNNVIINIKKIPVLVVSGHVNSEVTRDVIKEGAVDVLTKPYVLEEIVLKVDFWMDYKRKENEIINSVKSLALQKIIIEDQKKKLENKIVLEKQINQQKEKLLLQQSKMATMGAMLENIIHQWKQPLSAMSTNVSSVQLQKELDILDDGTLDTSLSDMMMVIGHLGNTIDDFRNYLKPDREQVVFKIDDAVEQAILLVGAQLRNKNIKVIKNSDDQTITGYKNDFIQSFLNILNNSKDALNEIETKNRFIVIDIKVLGDDKVEIKIKDTAGGIPSDIINKVFESHFTTKSKSGGTGIGLFMTKEMIEKHMGGVLEVENIDFEHENLSYTGAQFTITLPIK